MPPRDDIDYDVAEHLIVELASIIDPRFGTGAASVLRLFYLKFSTNVKVPHDRNRKTAY